MKLNKLKHILQECKEYENKLGNLGAFLASLGSTPTHGVDIVFRGNNYDSLYLQNSEIIEILSNYYNNLRLKYISFLNENNLEE